MLIGNLGSVLAGSPLSQGAQMFGWRSVFVLAGGAVADWGGVVRMVGAMRRTDLEGCGANAVGAGVIRFKQVVAPRITGRRF